MGNLKQKIIDHLLKNSDPPIVLRIKREITGSLTKEEENDLLDRITRKRSYKSYCNHRSLTDGSVTISTDRPPRCAQACTTTWK
ncbi:MAG TPA: hypothetical protein PLP87_09900 [Clostridiales bacterium]|nr:hypothetical protein [Clostridiales bacterium]